MPGTLKLKGWQPQRVPHPERNRAIRQYVKQAVFKVWNEKQRAATLHEIWTYVRDHIETEHKLGAWPSNWGFPGKRTVDRRVNEAADPRFYKDATPKIVAASAGKYQPNPELFIEEKGQ